MSSIRSEPPPEYGELRWPNAASRPAIQDAYIDRDAHKGQERPTTPRASSAWSCLRRRRVRAGA